MLDLHSVANLWILSLANIHGFHGYSDQYIPLCVPSTFLDALRTTVIGMEGQPLNTNFRQPQPLNSRQVMMQDDSG